LYQQKWDSGFSLEAKMKIALASDRVNNIGCAYSANKDVDTAIDYFNQALQIMPINDRGSSLIPLCCGKCT